VFKTIEMTDLYRLEKEKSITEIVSKFGDYTIATGVTVADYYRMRRLLREADESAESHSIIGPELKAA
jgi:hypothetical protein